MSVGEPKTGEPLCDEGLIADRIWISYPGKKWQEGGKHRGLGNSAEEYQDQKAEKLAPPALRHLSPQASKCADGAVRGSASVQCQIDVHIQRRPMRTFDARRQAASRAHRQFLA